MKRKILLIFILFYFYKSYSQDYYLSIRNLDVDVFAHCGVNSFEVDVYLLYNDDSGLERVYRSKMQPNGNDGSLFVGSVFGQGHTFKENEIKEIRVNVRLYEWDSHQSMDCGNNFYLSLKADLNGKKCTGASLTDVAGYDGNIKASFSYKLGPIIDIIQPTDNTITIDEPINAEVTAGFDSSLYNWEYQIGDSQGQSDYWYSISNASNNKLSLTLTDIFKQGAVNIINKNIYFRVKPCENITTRIITYSVIAGSPNLVGNPIAQKTSCNYKEDGTFTFTVDRDLDRDEKLIATLYYEFTPNNYNIPQNGQEEILRLVDNRNGTYSYTWQGKLPSGNYKLKYQTLIGTGEIPEVDPSWASLEFSNPNNPITIQPSLNVNFKATHLNDESCFKKGDGKIKLEVTSGESLRKFSYVIYKVDGNDVESIYRNWTEFEGRDTIIENLEKNKYRIKVRDNEGCFARL